MPKPNKCPKCGRELPEQVMGLCPDCLLGAVGTGKDFVEPHPNPVDLSWTEFPNRIGHLVNENDAAGRTIDFEAGDRVRITRGPFEGAIGSVDEVLPGAGDIRVIVTVFGRATPVDVDHRKVERV